MMQDAELRRPKTETFPLTSILSPMGRGGYGMRKRPENKNILYLRISEEICVLIKFKCSKPNGLTGETRRKEAELIIFPGF